MFWIICVSQLSIHTLPTISLDNGGCTVFVKRVESVS